MPAGVALEKAKRQKKKKVTQHDGLLVCAVVNWPATHVQVDNIISWDLLSDEGKRHTQSTLLPWGQSISNDGNNV